MPQKSAEQAARDKRLQEYLDAEKKKEADKKAAMAPKPTPKPKKSVWQELVDYITGAKKRASGDIPEEY